MKKVEVSPNNYVAVCNYCSKKFKFSKSGGYGTFWKHIKNQHKAEWEGTSARQQQITRYGNPNLRLFRYSDEQNREELARMVAVEHLSFSFGERVGFNNYCQKALNPAACRVPRTTLTRALFKIFRQEKTDLIRYFRNFKGYVTICADIWSDHWQTHSYLGVTCHWIDINWVMQKRVIAFRVFDDSHTATAIYTMLKHIFEEFNIDNKIFAIGFDNATNNTASIPYLKQLCEPNFGGQFFHQRCACHVLNLCVQSGFEMLREKIQPIRQALHFLWKHPQYMKQWDRFCKDKGMRKKRFARDVPTRWNSTYKLLAESYEYKDLLVRFFQHNNIGVVAPLYDTHWEACKKICELLKNFQDATNKLSGIYYPTTHLFAEEALNIVGALNFCQSDPMLQPCAIAMRAKWLQYYENIPIIYKIAVCFDPRYKFDLLHEYFTNYYDNLDLLHKHDPIEEANSVKSAFNKLYDEHACLRGQSSSHNTDDAIQTQGKKSSSSSFGALGKLGAKLMSRHTKKHRTTTGTGSYSEVDHYLHQPFNLQVDDDFDILGWWKEHETTFPILATLAKQVLGTPVSTVAVEQTFSASGNVLDYTRSQLSPDSIEAQCCVDDWTKAKNRQQEIDLNNSILEAYDINENESNATTGTEEE